MDGRRQDEADPIEVTCVRVVLDPRVRPALAALRAHPSASVEDLRWTAALIRRLRPAWRAIGVTVHDHVPATVREDRPVPPPGGRTPLMLTLVVESRGSLIDRAASTIEDARSKLEALSSIATADLRSLRTTLHEHLSSAIAEPGLLRLDAPVDLWFCSCGQPMIADVEQCQECGRASDPQAASDAPLEPLHFVA